MPNLAYDWKRFWCRREGRYSLSDDGFLVDPESELARYYPTDAVPFESIASSRCLVLLGEPGSGKSTAMQREYASAETANAVTGDYALWVDLREYSTDLRLSDKVFNSLKMQQWRNGTQILRLFLDSLDESLLRIDNISDVLRGELRELPRERLQIRLACRTADWPAGLEKGLREMWGENHVDVFELMPLRKIDVSHAAKSSSIPPEDFLNAIRDMDVSPLAIRPVTLRFLMRAYGKRKSFPTGRSALYTEGCKLLCEEHSESRRDSLKGRGALSADQRFQVASRLAAVTQFSNLSAIWTGSRAGDLQPEDVPVDCVVGGTEGRLSAETKIDVSAVSETLDTGLFSARGRNRLGWAHRTYEEFLGASYLLDRNVAAARILQLVLHPDGSRKVVPQLRETAAWLASISVDLFRAIAKTDPETILRSDVASASGKDRAELARELLASFESGDILEDHGLYQYFANLNNSDLPDIIRPYLTDRLRPASARGAAIGIAGACKVTALQSELVRMALDPTEIEHLRVRAAFTVTQIGDAVGRAELRPLAFGNAGPDPDDELKGCALEANWPERLPAHDLFAVMTEPRNPSFIGMYHHFLASDPVQHINVEDLEAALKWAAGHVGGHSGIDPLAKISWNIISRAIDHADRSEVCDLLTQTLVQQWPAFSYDRRIADRLQGADDNRRRIAKAMLPKLVSNPQAAIVLMDTCALGSDDVPWLVSEMEATSSSEEQAILAWVISRRLDSSDVDTFDAVLSAAKKYPSLWQEIRPLVEAVDLNSSEAERSKEHYRLFQKYQRPVPPASEQRTPADAEALNEILERTYPDRFAAIWQILNRGGRRPRTPKTRAYEVLPDWSSLDAAIRAGVLDAARAYLTDYPQPSTKKWWKDGQYPGIETLGYMAFSLIFTEMSSLLEGLHEADWQRWAPILVAYRPEGEPHELRSGMLHAVYDRVPQTVLDTIDDIIDGENERFSLIIVFQQLGEFWNISIADCVRRKLTSGAMKPQSFRTLLARLLQAGDSLAARHAESMVTRNIPSADDERNIVVYAATELLNHTPDAAWSTIWPILQADPPFGGDVIREAGVNFAAKLTEEQIAGLFVWLLPPGTAHDPEGRMTLVYNSLAGQLSSRGTAAACRALRRILIERPQFAVLRFYLRDAEERLRRNTWMPFSPAEIIRLASDASARIVRSGSDLVDVLLESLEELQSRLQGETPAVEDLWSDVQTRASVVGQKPKKLFRPKDESAFSNYIKRHLDQEIRNRGVIINREVEIRRSFGGLPGERTDIHIDLAIPTIEAGVFERVTVIIEVKGCWNRSRPLNADSTR
jgi:hypothetical protein